MTMNKMIYVLLVILVGGIVSCYDDKSKKANREIPEVTITTDKEILEAVYGKELIVKPVIKKGDQGSANLSYQWQVNLTPRGHELMDIGEGAELIYEVANEPSGNPYLLVLRVTDNDEGIDYYKMWDLYVSNSFGEGLLVAHTGNSGETSDLTFVKAPQVTYGYEEEPEYTRDIYSFANGGLIEGRVNSVVANIATNGATYNLSRLVIGTDKEIFSVDPVTFGRTMSNEDLFFQAPTLFKVETISTAVGNCLLTIIDGKAYGQIGNGAYQFFSPMNYAAGSTQVFNGKLAVEKTTSVMTAAFTCYDETNGYFVYGANFLVFNNGATSILTQQLGEGQYVFDPGNLPNKKAIAAGVGNNSEHLHLLRDLNSGLDTLFKISSISYVPGGTGKISINECTDITQAVDYAFCENMDVMYYATDDKIYPALLAGSSARSGTPWNLPSTGERITRVQVYQQAWYGNSAYSSEDYEFIHAQHQKQLLVSTYNSSTGEGKVYIVPITTLGTGALGEASQVLTGFGEITAIGTTLK